MDQDVVDDPWIAQESEITQLILWMRAQGVGPALSQDQLRRSWTLIGELEFEVLATIRSQGVEVQGLCRAFDVIDEAVMMNRIGIELLHHAAYNITRRHAFVTDAITMSREALQRMPGMPIALRVLIEPPPASAAQVIEPVFARRLQ